MHVSELDLEFADCAINVILFVLGKQKQILHYHKSSNSRKKRIKPIIEIFSTQPKGSKINQLCNCDESVNNETKYIGSTTGLLQTRNNKCFKQVDNRLLEEDCNSKDAVKMYQTCVDNKEGDVSLIKYSNEKLNIPSSFNFQIISSSESLSIKKVSLYQSLVSIN